MKERSALQVNFDWIDALGMLTTSFGVAAIEHALGLHSVVALPSVLIFPILRRALGKGPAVRSVKRAVSLVGVISMLLMTLGFIVAGLMAVALWINVTAPERPRPRFEEPANEAFERELDEHAHAAHAKKITSILQVGGGAVVILVIGGLLDRWRTRRDSASALRP